MARETTSQNEDQYRAVLSLIDEGIGILEPRLGPDGRIADLVLLEANESFGRQIGIVDPVGRTMRELLPEFGAECLELCIRVVKNGASARIERSLQAIGRGWFKIRCSRIDGPRTRIAVVIDDITDRRHATHAIKIHTALLGELQHRVRNMLSAVSSMTDRTGTEARSVPEFSALMAGRLQTFARVQKLLTRAGNVGVDVETILRDELRPRVKEANRYELSGPHCVLSPLAAEVLALSVHELTSGALKHGALSTADGSLDVHWRRIEKPHASWISFDWVEQGAGQRGYGQGARQRQSLGREIIEERIPYELGGVGSLAFGHDGVRCHIGFPLQYHPSVLETGAPESG